MYIYIYVYIQRYIYIYTNTSMSLDRPNTFPLRCNPCAPTSPRPRGSLEAICDQTISYVYTCVYIYIYICLFVYYIRTISRRMTPREASTLARPSTDPPQRARRRASRRIENDNNNNNNNDNDNTNSECVSK